MSRLSKVTPEQAEGKTAELYGAIKASLGGVPNLFQGLGTNARALEVFLGIGGGLRGGALSNREQESIALAVAQRNTCDYCLAANTVLGKMGGLSEAEMLANRQGGSEDQKKNALLKFVGEVVEKKGNVSDETLKAFRAAGYSDAHVGEILLSVVQNIYTNYYNNLNRTEVDFPAAPKL